MTAGRGMHGASLVELLISVMFLGLFAIMLHQFCRTMLHGVRVLEVASEAQEAARIGIQLIVRDLRGAGFSPGGSLPNGVSQAGPDAIEIVRDLNGDGDTNDSNEMVAYSLNEEKHALMRRMGQASPQPMLNDVATDGLQFAYRSGDGAVISAGSSALDAGERARIRRIDVRLAIDAPHPDPAYRSPIRAVQTASVCLRNG